MGTPKIIHYCWFGDKEIPEEQQEYIKKWKELLPDYKFMLWNEDNFSDDSKFFTDAIRLKKYAFLSDVVRFKALYSWGGVYLDTDVDVFKKFDSYLNYDFFCGYIFDSLLGTAVLGSKKGNHLIMDMYKYMIAEYEKTGEFKVSNNWVTQYFLDNVPGFRLNGKTQIVENMFIGNRFYFEKMNFKKDSEQGVSIHKCAGSWRKKEAQGIKGIVKKIIGQRFYYWLSHEYCLRKNPFYDTYKKEIKNEKNKSYK